MRDDSRQSAIAVARISFEHSPTIEAIAIPAEHFDGVLCNSVLEYLDNPRRAISEFRRVLKRNGVLIVSVPNSASIFRKALKAILFITQFFGQPWPKWLQFSRHDYFVEDFHELLAKEGFEIRSSSFMGGRMPAAFSRVSRFGPLICVFARKTH